MDTFMQAFTGSPPEGLTHLVGSYDDKKKKKKKNEAKGKALRLLVIGTHHIN